MMRIFFFIPGIGWLFICTFLLTIPGTSLPQEDWLDKIWFDKWVHVGLFAGIVVTWCWAISKGRFSKPTYHFLWVMWLTILYGIAMEFVQRYLVVNRSFDAFDIVADALGAYAGYLFSRRFFIKK